MSKAAIEIPTLSADVAFVNGKIITVNANDEIAEALSIRGHRILRVGERPFVEQTLSHNTKLIDLNA